MQRNYCKCGSEISEPFTHCLDCARRLGLDVGRKPETPAGEASNSTDLFNAIRANEEVVISAWPREQLDASEPRFRFEIEGPERLISKLAAMFLQGR